MRTLEIKKGQHCTSEECSFSLSHTAGWCGYEQPRRCSCAFCYPDDEVAGETPPSYRDLADALCEVVHQTRCQTINMSLPGAPLFPAVTSVTRDRAFERMVAMLRAVTE